MISGGGRGGQRFRVHGLEGSHANQMRQSSRIVAISLVGFGRLERLMGLPALDAQRRDGSTFSPTHRRPPLLLDAVLVS
jgi:hypothetical protein